VKVTKILCVDDEPALLRAYKDELSEEGFEVILAQDGKKALALFSEENPQVVVLDIRMPQMDGMEALVTLLGKDGTIPVILHTAYPEYQENFITWGAEAFVMKSADLSELKKIIREILQRKRGSAEGSAQGSSATRRKSP
jgi:DNA-binding response OmpR family regulator